MLKPVEPAADLVESVLQAFNGGLINKPDATNRRGYVTRYLPHEAMRAALAPHMAAIRDAALDEAAEACIEQREAYLSPQYATGQPLSSIMERMACTTCSDAILALKDKP